jgi:hypothetical protein
MGDDDEREICFFLTRSHHIGREYRKNDNIITLTTMYFLLHTHTISI